MQEKTKGIVLHSIRYGDNSLIVDIFTASHGTLAFLVRAPRSRRSVLRNVLLCPLTILEIDFDYRDTQKLQRLSDVRVDYPYHTVPYHPLKETIALFLGEFLYYALRDEHRNPALYSYLEHSLQWLDRSNGNLANYPVTFLIRLSRFLGIWPNEEEAQKVLRVEEQPFVPLILRMDFFSMHLFHFSSSQRARLLQILNDYYRMHVPGFPEMKSMAILREVLS